RYLNLSWTNLNPGVPSNPAWRITQVQGPFNTGGQPIYTVTYEYGADFNLWKAHQDPLGLNRITTFTYTTYSDQGGTETGLLASIADPLGHTVTYSYALGPTGTVWVSAMTEPGSGGTVNWT